ncbi:MAG: ATP synthase F1 subunit delta [Oscillospiraceae bacterium]|nr:ATP synthase F1 subunit delta [Oscillospiraceae bacterium]
MEKLSFLYANALFDLAIKHGQTDEFLEQTISLHDALADYEMQRILKHPHISAAEKKKFFKEAFSGRVHDDLLGFLYLAADKNRESYIIPAFLALIDMIRRYKGTVTAQVSSAVALDDKQAERLKNLLSQKLNKRVELKLKVEPKLIGGPYIFVDGYYIDWTLKKRLRDLTVHMKEVYTA